MRCGLIDSVRMLRSVDPATKVRALAWDIVLCSWARHFTLKVPLSCHGLLVYKFVNLILGTDE